MSNLILDSAYQSDSRAALEFLEDIVYCTRHVRVSVVGLHDEGCVLTWDERRKDAKALLTLDGRRSDLALVARIWIEKGHAFL